MQRPGPTCWGMAPPSVCTRGQLAVSKSGVASSRLHGCGMLWGVLYLWLLRPDGRMLHTFDAFFFLYKLCLK